MTATMTNPIVMPEYGTEIVVLPIADLLEENDKGEIAPRTLLGTQRPLQIKHWRVRVGPFDVTKIGVVAVIEIDDVMYVTDGQHRVYAASLLGYTHMRAEFSKGADASDAAGSFIAHNTSKAVTRRVMTEVSITAGDPLWTDILTTLDWAGFQLRSPRGSGPVGFRMLQGDATLERIHRRGNLASTLWLYGKLGEHWVASAKQPSAFMLHLSAFLAAYPDVQGPRLLARLNSTTLVKLEQSVATAEMKVKTSRSTLYIWALVDIWNGKLGTDSPLRLAKKDRY